MWKNRTLLTTIGSEDELGHSKERVIVRGNESLLSINSNARKNRTRHNFLERTFQAQKLKCNVCGCLHGTGHFPSAVLIKFPFGILRMLLRIELRAVRK